MIIRDKNESLAMKPDFRSETSALYIPRLHVMYWIEVLLVCTSKLCPNNSCSFLMFSFVLEFSYLFLLPVTCLN